MRVEVRQIGIVLFLLGLLLPGLSIGFRESEEEAIVRRASLRRHVLIGYRVRIWRWIFWSGLVLMAVAPCCSGDIRDIGCPARRRSSWCGGGGGEPGKMSEMNEQFKKSQEEPPDRPPLREVSREELEKILEAHQKWVESTGKDGEKANLQGTALRGANLEGATLGWADLQGANLFGARLQGATLGWANLEGATLAGANLQEASLFGADLQGASLFGADLQGAELNKATGLTPSQVKEAENWQPAFYSTDFLKKLGLPPDHNDRVKKKLAELGKEKKAAGTK